MATETLRPNAAGDECAITHETGADCPDHYQNVDEADVGGDGDTTEVNDDWEGARDLYNIENHSVGSGTINFIKVYAVCKASVEPERGSLKIAIKTGGTAYESTAKTVTTDYASYSEQWTQNPGNAHAWTWDEIDALQIGIALASPINDFNAEDTFCTQVYVEVDYTPPQSVGSGSIAIAATLVKYTKLEATKMGAGAVSLAGALSPIRTYAKAVGGGAITIAGTVAGAVVASAQAVGGGAVGIAGSLAKYTKLEATKMGAGALAIAGHASKKMYQTCGNALLDIRGYITRKRIWTSVGGATLNIAGSLNAVRWTAQAVGQATLNIAGALVTDHIVPTIGRALKVVVITAQYRKMNIITAMYRKIKAFTSRR